MLEAETTPPGHVRGPVLAAVVGYMIKAILVAITDPPLSLAIMSVEAPQLTFFALELLGKRANTVDAGVSLWRLIARTSRRAAVAALTGIGMAFGTGG